MNALRNGQVLAGQDMVIHAMALKRSKAFQSM